MNTVTNVDSLKKAITDSRFEIALKAIESLDQDAEWAIEPLLEIYKAGHPRLKYLSALALIKLREPRVKELLLQDLRATDKWGHRDGNVNVVAAWALACVERNPEIIEALRQAMTEKETVSGWFSTMGFVIPKLGMPQSEPYTLQEVAGLSLVELGDKDSGKQIVQLAIQDWHWHIPKERFIKYMYDSGWESTISDVASLLQNKQCLPTVISCLGIIGDEQCVDPLIKALKHETPDIRKKAIEALANIGGVRALEAITHATNDKNWGVRHTAQKMIKKLSRDK